MSIGNDDAVLLPCRYNPDSTVFSNQIAHFLAQTIEAPLLHEGNQADLHGMDTLFVINYPFAFCGMPEYVAEAVRLAKRVVWVENDYTIVPPRTMHTGPKSPIRLAFGNRKQPLIYWTNRPDHATGGGAYVNWNLLSYQPCVDVPYSERNGRVVYYGSHRAGRVSSFKRFFSKHITVACSVRTQKKFWEYGCPLVEPLQPMIAGLAQYSGSLYLEDDDTHDNYHSPANRYYEALAAGTALLIDAACLPTFKKAKIDLDPSWIVHSAVQCLHRPLEILADQQALTLRQDFRSHLKDQVLAARRLLGKV